MSWLDHLLQALAVVLPVLLVLWASSFPMDGPSPRIVSSRPHTPNGSNGTGTWSGPCATKATRVTRARTTTRRTRMATEHHATSRASLLSRWNGGVDELGY